MVKKYPDFWHFLLGSGPYGILFGSIVVAWFCAFLLIVGDVSRRRVYSTNTPVQWSTKFFLIDNFFRLIVNMMVVPLVLRMIYEGKSPTAMFIYSVGIGFGADGLMLLLKNFGIVTTTKWAQTVSGIVGGLTPPSSDNGQKK